MRKQYLILETTQFDRPAPMVAPREERIRRPAGEDGLVVRGRPPAAAQPQPNPERYLDWEDMHFVLCFSMHDAEEYVEDVLVRNPQFKFVIFESVSFLETAASPTVRKVWDQNGQLVETHR